MRKLIVLVFIIAISFKASAQNLKFGPIVGGVITNLGVENFSTSNNPGINFGVFLEFGKNKWAGETNLMLLLANSPYKGALIMPVHLKYYISNKFYFKFGPTFGAKLYDMDLIYGDNHRRYFAGIGCGLGYTISKRLSIDVTYDRSLTSISYPYSNLGLAFKWNILKINQ